MTIQGYIKKYELTLWRKWPEFGGLQTPWMPTFFTDDESGKTVPPPDRLEKFEIYANSEKTRFVSINVTRGLFRIIHYELIPIVSEWQPVNRNYELQSIL
jgi:hypothetical protein